MLNVGAIGYAVCSVAFLALSVFLVFSARESRQGIFLLLASVFTVVWSAFASYQAFFGYVYGIYLFIFEFVREGFWILFLVVLLINANFTGRVKESLILLGKATLIYLFFFSLYLLLVRTGYISPRYHIGLDGLALSRLVVVIIGLIFIEQLFRNSRPENRWAVKFLFFGIGGLLVYEFYLYTDALLFNRIDSDIWNARGFVNALAVPLIATSIVRNKSWSIDLFVSREIVFHSVAVTGIGGYLLFMAAGGYYIRDYGGGWGAVAQIAFFFGAIFTLLVLMFSAQIRARFRVFIVKHFRQYKYDYREEWSRVIRLLSTKQNKQELLGNAIHVIADIVESTEAGIWTKDGAGNYKAVATWNMDAFEKITENEASSMIQYLHRWQWVINLDEYEKAPEIYQDLKLPIWVEGEERFWLIVPLMLQTELYGFALLGRSRAPVKISWEERDLLLTVGRQITSYFALMDMDEALAETRQFEAYNRLSAYVVHDLKNLVAQLSLVISNAAKHKSNQEFLEDAIETVENAVTKMSKLLSQLRKGFDENISLKPVCLDTLLKEVVEHREHQYPMPELIINDCGLLVRADKNRLAAVIEHLVQNGQEATSDNGKVEIILRSTEDRVVIEIADSGCGMDKSFIQNRLYKPFDTTKGNAGMGIGVYESREFIKSLGGFLEVESEVHVGTIFRIHLLLETSAHQNAASLLQDDVVST